MSNFLDIFSIVKLSKEKDSIVLLELYSLRTGSRWVPARTNESAACQVDAAVSAFVRIIL